MNAPYDCIVVGARCAGATFATFMARAGAKVLVVDQATLPSEVVLSTHTVHPSGMAVLDDLGVGDAVRSYTPEMTSMRLNWDGTLLDIPFETRHGEYCPRRKRFDHLLQQAARDAGVNLRDKTAVTGLVWEAGRVVGVELRHEGGTSERVFAPLVVGADGRNSKVADWVSSPYYFDYEPPRGIYWSYWPAPNGWGSTADYPAGMYISRKGPLLCIAFLTDDNCVLLGTLPLRAQVRDFKTAPLVSLRAALAQDPMLEPLVHSDPVERPRGYLGERYFFRKASGPGWLLLGDAGLHKDFLSGDGISEALLQASGAARALLAPSPTDAPELRLERWAITRDLDALPGYRNTQALAAESGRSELNRALFPKISARPALQRAFAETFARKRSPFETLPVWQVTAWVLGAALQGNVQVLREFMARGQLIAEVGKEQRRLRQQLAELSEPKRLTPQRRSRPRAGFSS